MGRVTLGEQLAELWPNRHRQVAVAPFAHFEPCFCSCPSEKPDLSRLPQIEDDVVRTRQVAVADEEADQAQQRLGGEAPLVESEPLERFTGPSGRRHVAMRAMEHAVCGTKVKARSGAAGQSSHFR